MLLDNVISCQNLSENTRSTLWLVISSINVLLSLVNDQLDLKMIEKGKFMPKLENFEPEKTFQFIINMFGPQATITNNVLEFSSDKENDPLPSFIIGD